MDKWVKFLQNIWNHIKHIFLKIIKFFKNIVSYFRHPDKLKKLQDDSDLIAVSIKENLDTGNYNVVNCLYNSRTENVVDLQEDAEGITAENIDSTTSDSFGNKSMIVIK